MLAAGGICVPLYSAPEASSSSAKTLSSLIGKRQRSTHTKWYCSNRDDPSTCTTTTWTEGEGQGDGQRSSGGGQPGKAQAVPQTQEDETTGNDESTTQTDNSNTSTGTNNNNNNNPPTTTSTDANSMLATINKWRTAYNKPQLTWSQDLVASSAKTGRGNNGKGGETFQHGGAGNAEVMTPGGETAGGADLKGYSPFEASYILGWLCEVPTGPVAGACADLKSIVNMDYRGGRGHFDILVDDAYTQIGCAFTRDPDAGEGYIQGLWICDLKL
ncbi:MAG: hypothetical protein L6R36_008678 [Xanthoria steineri]|nr:MAG: hypothetical protein L6R36_008678 [Xanthoria steineri]